MDGLLWYTLALKIMPFFILKQSLVYLTRFKEIIKRLTFLLHTQTARYSHNRYNAYKVIFLCVSY